MLLADDNSSLSVTNKSQLLTSSPSNCKIVWTIQGDAIVCKLQHPSGHRFNHQLFHKDGALHNGAELAQEEPGQRLPPSSPVDVEREAVGLPSHGGRVGLQQEATQELNEGLLISKLVQLVHQSCTQLIFLTAQTLAWGTPGGIRKIKENRWMEYLTGRPFSHVTDHRATLIRTNYFVFRQQASLMFLSFSKNIT